MDFIGILIAALLGQGSLVEDDFRVAIAADYAKAQLVAQHPECVNPEWDFSVDAMGNVSIYAISEACEVSAGFYRQDGDSFTFAVEGA